MKTKKHCSQILDKIQRNKRDSSYPLPEIGYDYESALRNAEEKAEGYPSCLAYYNSDEWFAKYPRYAQKDRRISICLIRMLLIDRNFKITSLGRHYLQQRSRR